MASAGQNQIFAGSAHIINWERGSRPSKILAKPDLCESAASRNRERGGKAVQRDERIKK